MNRISKSSALVLILILTVSSLMMVEPASAASAPSVPEFTVKYVDLSYDVPPTYGTDQYTGQTVMTQEGEHIDNRTVEFTIKNQPFTSFTDANGNYTTLYYNFRVKGHYGDQWTNYPFSNQPSTLYPSTSGQSTWRYSDFYSSFSPKYPASTSEYTEVSIGFNFFNLRNAPLKSQVDFQVQAMTGYIAPINSGPISGDGFYSFTGQFSNWSNTQTITIGETAPTSTPSVSPPLATPNPTSAPTATPQQPSTPTGTTFNVGWEQTVIVVLVVSVAALLVVVGLLWRKISKK